jgi:predicted metal-binding protein
MTKIGIIRCQEESQVCCASRCLEGIKLKNGVFKNYEEVILVGIDTCGGCPGNLSKDKAYNMIRFAGAEVIHIANCILTESDLKYTHTTEEEIYSKMLSKPKKRLNDNEFLRKRAKLIANNSRHHFCPYKDKIINDIKTLGVKVVEHTHGP